MKIIPLIAIAALTLVMAVAQCPAAEGKGKGKKPKDEKIEPAESKKSPTTNAKITVEERVVIQSYLKTFDEPKKPGKKNKTLPPGLEKKLARGGSLPPGWQKKVLVGEILPAEVLTECHPLPAEVVVKLPAPPVGVITVTVEGKIVRLLEATREILDVFDIWN